MTRRRSSALGVALLLCIPSVSSAQVPTFRLPDITITGSRLTDSIADASGRYSLSGDSLRASGLLLVSDALRDLPGVHLLAGGSDGAVTSLFVRGGESDYVRVLVDGITLNEAGGAFDFAGLSLANVDRIEVVQGPGSVVHGSGAMTGVIHIVTRSGRMPGGHASMGGGAFGRKDGSIAIRGGGTRLGWSAGADGMLSDGRYPVNSEFANFNASGRLDLLLTTGTGLVVTGRFGRHQYNFPTDGSGMVSDSNQFTVGGLGAGGVTLTHRVSPGLAAVVRATGTVNALRFDDAPDSPGDTSGFAFTAERHSRSVRGGLDGFVRAALPAGVRVIGGLGLEVESFRSSGSYQSNFGDGTVTDDEGRLRATRRTLGLYSEIVAPLAPALRAGAGARLDINSAFGLLPTLRADIRLQPAAVTVVRVAAGLAFKSPTFGENFAETPFEVGDPQLDPERALSVDGSLSHEFWNGQVAIAVTGYVQRFRDLIQYTFQGEGFPTYVNLGGAIANGADVTARFSPLPVLTIGAAQSLLHTSVTKSAEGGLAGAEVGTRLLRRPSATTRAWLEYRPRPGTLAGARVTRTGARDDFDFGSFPFERVTLPSVATVDLYGSALVARFGAATLHLDARMANMFDAQFESIAGFPAAGRAFRAGAGVSW